MKTSIQEQIPAWYFARHAKYLDERLVDKSRVWVQRAKKQTKRSAEREFLGRGFDVLYRELSFGGVRLRARLSLRDKEVLIDPSAEADLHQELDTLGFPLFPSPKDLVLSHELFHLFCPRCPSSVAEIAAHLYCAEILELDYFPGLLDLADQFPASRLHQRPA